MGASRLRALRRWCWTVVVSAPSVLAVACASDPPRPAGPGPGPEAVARPTGVGLLALGTAGLGANAAGALARQLASGGLRAANAPCSLLRWSAAAEPQRWEPIDAWVRELQAAGYRDLELCLDFAGVPSGDALLAPRSPVPPPARHAELAAWAARVAERYDADGSDDAPGLEAPVDRFRLGSALGPGGVEPFDDFPPLLASVRRELLAASPAALLVLPPMRARGAPPGDLAPRLEALAAHPARFDAWSVEASGSAAELDAWLGWLAERTPGVAVEVVGGTARPLAEAGTASRCPAPASERPTLDPALAETDRCILAAAFAELLAGVPETVAWARAEVARDLVIKGIVAASRGVRRVELGLAGDASWWTHPSLEAGAGLAAWSGLLVAGRAHPALYALRQLDGWLYGRERVERLPAADPRVHVYLLEGEAGRAWVGWSEPDAFVAPGEPPPTRRVALDVGADHVVLEQALTATGTRTPEVDDRETAGGRLWLELTPTPLFLREGRAPTRWGAGPGSRYPTWSVD